LFRLRPSLSQEAAKASSPYQGRSLIVDRLQPLPQPSSHSVFVDSEET
jgi:hypothetical protein